MTTRCFKPIFGKRMRVTKMNSCCLPVTGGNCAEVVTDGFISLSLSSEVEDGAEVVVKKASGAVCFQQKAPDSFKRFTLEMEFCGVDPDLLSFMTNMSPYTDWNGDIAGATAYEGVVDQKFGLEVWTGLAGDACPTGVEEASGYIVLGCVNAGVLGDITVDGENAVSFTMQGAYTVSGHGWGVGLYPVVLNGAVPALLPTPIMPSEPLLILETGVAPPPVQCGCKAHDAA
jgi:hypothetical protein